jgi:hypothetical protein
VIDGLPEQYKKSDEKVKNEVKSLSNSKYDVFAISASNITDKESRVVYSILSRASCSNRSICSEFRKPKKSRPQKASRSALKLHS